MIVAHKPLSPQEELAGQKEWLESLRDELDKGNLKEVRDSITLEDTETQLSHRSPSGSESEY